MENNPGRKKLPLVIENVKVELSVTSKANAKGDIDFYIFSGDVIKENISTQKNSFNIVKEKTNTLLHLGITPLLNSTSPEKNLSLVDFLHNKLIQEIKLKTRKVE